MKKQKLILVVIISILFAFTVVNCIFVNNVNAADQIEAKETSKTSNGQTVKWKYELDEDGNIVKLICTNEKTELSGTLTIPATIDGKKVISLGVPYALNGTLTEFTGLQGIVISDGIQIIDSNAFDGCTGLKSVTIPNSVTSLAGFSRCSGLKSITIPDSVTSLGEWAFSNCDSLTSITLSKNLTEIRNDTFWDCNSLTEIKIPEKVTTIRATAFGKCKNLTKILIPESVATIEESDYQLHNKNLTIYGVEGSRAESYAKEKSIKFDIIANWDNGEGADVTAPTVSKMSVSNISTYYNQSTEDYRVPSNTKLKIEVEFSENIIGETAPTLTIKIGDGEEIELTNGTIAGKTITYEYTTKSTDSGKFKVAKFEGGDVTDEAGNEAELSVKDITSVYADNNAPVNTNGDNNNNGSNNNNNGNDGKVDGKIDRKEDPTIAQGKIPQTGQSVAIVAIIAVLLIIAIVIFKFTKKYKGIK